jgi:signal peptidase I
LLHRGATPSKPKRGFTFPWRPLLVLIVVVVLARVFLCSQVRVSTGSMEPTIHGDPARGDQLLVFNPWFTLTSPARFELALLEPPEAQANEKLMVKRIVGLPGETLRIYDGDLYVQEVGGGREQRIEKTYREFRPLLIRRFFAKFGGDLDRCFNYDPSQLQAIARGVAINGPEARPEDPNFALDPRAVTFDDGWIDPSGAEHPGEELEHDLLFDLEVETTSDATCIGFSLDLGVSELRYDIVPYSSGHTILLTRTTDRAAEPYSQPMRCMSAKSKHHVEFFYIDGQAGVAVDERQELMVSLPPIGGVVGAGSRGARSAGFSVWAGGVRITRFEVWRDIHYTEPPELQYGGRADACRIPNDKVFVLGDHSEESTDSRIFGPVPLKNLRGRPFFIQSPNSRLGLIY